MIPFHKNPLGLPRVSSTLKQLLQGAQGWMFLVSPEGKILQVSESVSRDLHLDSRLSGLPLQDLDAWTPESRQKLEHLFGNAPLPAEIQLDMTSHQGLHFTLTPIQGPTGKTTSVVLETQPQQAADQTLSGVLEHAQIALAVLDGNEKLLWGNRALSKLLGVPHEDLSQVHLPRVIGMSVADRSLDDLQFHTKWLREDGQAIWINVGVRQIAPFDTGTPYTLLELSDATAELSVRHELEGMRSQLEFALQSSGVGTWEWEVQSDTLTWDARMCEMYGLQQDTFLGRFADWPPLVHPEDSAKVVGFTFQALSGHSNEAEFRILLPDGSVRHTKVVAHQIKDGAGHTLKIMGTSWDITREKRIELDLREAHRIAQIASWKWDLVHSTLDWSDEFRRMLGFTAEAPVPDIDTLNAVLAPHSRQTLQEVMQEAILNQDDFALDVELQGKSKTRWLHLKGRIAQNREGQAVMVYGTAQDITESKTAREELLILSNRLLLATEAGGIGIWEWDSASMCIEMDRKMCDLMGLPEGSPSNQDVYRMIHERIHQDDQLLLEEFFRSVAEGKQQGQDILHADFRVLLPRNRVRVLRSHAKVLPGSNPGSYRMLGTAWDITDQKTTEHLIRHQANHDALTDLPNRRLFFELLSQEIKNTQRTDQACAVLFIDLDRFKEVNDTYGHQAGDELLKEVSNRLKMCTRASDVLARLSGDEFVIMLTHLTEITPAAMIAERILAILSHPVRIGRENLTITASIGIAVYPDDADDANKLLIYADQAMYNAKNEGKNRYAFFQKAMQDQAVEKRTLTVELNQAIKRNELEMYYQPILDLNSHRIVKAEALLRWKHPEKGFISPAVFIPIAEESDLIHALGDWVFRTVIQQVKVWNRLDMQPIDVSVNVSAKQFLQKGTMERFMGYIQEAGISPDRLIIEITESVFLQDAFEIAEQFRLIQEAGIRLALDDFGTGYSSLNYLTRFDTRFIKIDRSFVKNLETDTSSPIIDAIIAMSHQLGKTVIAEGVETLEQVEWLKARDCDYVQGYYYARPMPAGDFVKFVEQFLEQLNPENP
ncbi:bifunctional diguanylate cyclase/phosphodiesterase [Deinococcus roseus]|uniref:Diguanylate cyclase n=1 Tax=Deinococcus roseus TaxID=392414 RepID=A0ABQ2D054_9DEIO|nr:EAL domain-containing protein [Deinococcus roseus]GGJ26663.1 diguanylate cyclase [Deinococcus roseus]